MDSTEFLQRVRQSIQMDDADEDWTDSEILLEATQCVYERFVQPLVNVRSGHWLQTYETTTTAGVPFVRIPPRAVAQGLELFCTTGPNGSGLWRQLHVLTNAQSVDYLQANYRGVPECFSFESDMLTLFPTPATAYPLQIKFYLRPATLVAVPDYQGTIIDIYDSSTLVIDSPDTATPPPWDDQLVDIVNLDGNNETVLIDVPVNFTATGDATSRFVYFSQPFTTLQLAKLRDNGSQAVVTAGSRWNIPLPVELHSALVTFTGAAILVDKGDAEKAAQLVSRCEAAVKAIVDVMTPRVKTRPFTFKTRNTYLRRRAGWRMWR